MSVDKVRFSDRKYAPPYHEKVFENKLRKMASTPPVPAATVRPAEEPEEEEEEEDEEEEYSFLPLVHEIIKCLDKDSPDVHRDLNALKNKFQAMRKMINAMPGIDLSPEQQQQEQQNLREQVRTKNELLQKYKSLCMFEIPKE
ncbi:mediator of RNA polymerase II transcription subunit 9 [Ambystoma mexicanum]|uniref:mediator of RNA polymerase II transcription subunit 9 n=1 Tax=Ambystoma mexicanum TaxID=8296 RepID=UPI0037E82ED0